MAKEAAIAVTALLLAVVAGLIGFLPFLATQFTGSPNIGEWDRS